MGQRLGIAGDDGARNLGVRQAFDNVGQARVQQDIPGPRAQGRGRLKEEQPQPVGLHHRVQILVKTGPPARPGRQGGVPGGVDFGADLVIHLAQHGLQQPCLVAEVMVQGAARQPGLGGDPVQRHFGKAARRKGRPCHRQQAMRGVLRHLGAAAAVG